MLLCSTVAPFAVIKKGIISMLMFDPAGRTTRSRLHRTGLTLEEKRMIERYVGVMLASLLWSTGGSAAPGCPAIEQFLTGKAVGVVCFHSDDLRTNNALTTP